MKFSRIQFRKKKKTTRNLAQVQADTLAEMGSHLRQLRQDRSLTLDWISRQTLIPSRLLNAIEEGKLEKLPEPVYIQGFVRRFADVLGLDGIEYARQFPTGLELKPRSRSWRDSSAAQLRPLHLYLLYISIVIFSVRSIASVNQPAAVDRPPPTSLPAPSPDPAPSQAPTATPNKSNARPASSASQNQPVRVGITITDESWIMVVADGETAFEGILSEGTHSWSAREELTVMAGNAGGVMIAVNGNEAQPMGEPGSVEEVTFVADSRAATSSDTNPQPN